MATHASDPSPSLSLAAPSPHAMPSASDAEHYYDAELLAHSYDAEAEKVLSAITTKILPQLLAPHLIEPGLVHNVTRIMLQMDIRELRVALQNEPDLRSKTDYALTLVLNGRGRAKQPAAGEPPPAPLAAAEAATSDSPDTPKAPAGKKERSTTTALHGKSLPPTSHAVPCTCKPEPSAEEKTASDLSSEEWNWGGEPEKTWSSEQWKWQGWDWAKESGSEEWHSRSWSSASPQGKWAATTTHSHSYWH